MISFTEMPMIADDVLRLSDVNDFLKMLAVFKSRSSKLTKRCLKREALNFLDFFGGVASVNDEELNSRSEILEYK